MSVSVFVSVVVYVSLHLAFSVPVSVSVCVFAFVSVFYQFLSVRLCVRFLSRSSHVSVFALVAFSICLCVSLYPLLISLSVSVSVFVELRLIFRSLSFLFLLSLYLFVSVSIGLPLCWFSFFHVTLCQISVNLGLAVSGVSVCLFNCLSVSVCHSACSFPLCCTVYTVMFPTRHGHTFTYLKNSLKKSYFTLR